MQGPGCGMWGGSTAWAWKEFCLAPGLGCTPASPSSRLDAACCDCVCSAAFRMAACGCTSASCCTASPWCATQVWPLHSSSAVPPACLLVHLHLDSSAPQRSPALILCQPWQCPLWSGSPLCLGKALPPFDPSLCRCHLFLGTVVMQLGGSRFFDAYIPALGCDVRIHTGSLLRGGDGAIVSAWQPADK